MSGVRDVRKSIGMTQEQMATFLQITRSQLSMAEGKKRSLTAAALIKLGQLQSTLSKGTSSLSIKATQTLQKQTQRHRTLISRHLQHCSEQAAQLSIKLKIMKEDYKRCMQALQAAHQSTIDKNNPTDALTIALVEQKALKKLEQCGLGAQAILTLKIKVLNYEVDQASKLIF